MAEFKTRKLQSSNFVTEVDATDPIPVVAAGGSTTGLKLVQYEATVVVGDGDKEITFTGNAHGFLLYHHSTITTIQVSIDGGTTWAKLGSHGSTGELFRIPGGANASPLTSIHVKSGSATVVNLYIASYEEA